MSNSYGDVERTIIETSYDSGVRIEQETDFVCGHCGSDKIQERAWVDINTKEYEGSCDDEEVYCPDCTEFTCMVTRKEWDDINEEPS